MAYALIEVYGVTSFVPQTNKSAIFYVYAAEYKGQNVKVYYTIGNVNHVGRELVIAEWQGNARNDEI